MDAGVALHCITGQPGGHEALHAKLQAYDPPAGVAPDLSLHSSPDHSAMFPGTENIFVTKAAPIEDPKYNLIQPAMVIINDMGKVVQSWSWKSETDVEGNVGCTEMQMIAQPAAGQGSQDAFQSADADASGALNAEELQKSGITGGMEAIDKDQDGTISLEEYQQYVEAQPRQQPVPLVTLRIVSDDILQAIKDGREVKRAFVM